MDTTDLLTESKPKRRMAEYPRVGVLLNGPTGSAWPTAFGVAGVTVNGTELVTTGDVVLETSGDGITVVVVRLPVSSIVVREGH